jgi:hypothetical protein
MATPIQGGRPMESFEMAVRLWIVTPPCAVVHPLTYRAGELLTRTARVSKTLLPQRTFYYNIHTIVRATKLVYSLLVRL